MIVTQTINIKNGYILETKISNLKHIIMIYLTSHDKNDRQIFFYPTAVIEFHYNYHTPKRM